MLRYASALLPLVVVTACTSAPKPVAAHDAPSAKPARFDAAAFEAVRARYMNALDDRAADETQVAIDMESALLPIVDAALHDDATHGLAPDDKASAGLAMIYDALFLARDIQHVHDGKIDGARLFAAHRYSDLAQDAAEVHARRGRALALLQRAASLRPDDGRIASWVAAADAAKDADAGAPPSTAGMDKLIAAVDVAPTFNLWTAFIAMRDVPIDAPAAQALFQKTRSFLDAKICRDPAPGSAEEKNCKSGPRAPFNTQAAVVMLGDQYLRRGEAALAAGDVPTAMPLLGTARGIYGTLHNEANKSTTASWRNAGLLDVREKRAAALHPGAPVPADGFWTAHDAEAVYDCASCHAR